MTKRKCQTCQGLKAPDQFRRVSTIFGGDGLSKDCNDCRAQRRAEKRAGAEAPSPPPAVIAVLSRTPSLGYRAEQRGDDVVIIQESADGTAQVWLSIAEARELAQFFTALQPLPQVA